MAEAPSSSASTDESAAEIARLHVELQRRGSVIRDYEVALEAEHRKVAKAHADLEEFTRWLERAENERDERTRQVAYLEQTKPTGLAAWWHARKTFPPPPAPLPLPYTDVPGVDFVYYLCTSPYRVYREPAFMLQGWAFPRSGEPVTALRARVDGVEFFGTYGLDEPSVIAHFGPQPNNPRPGFKIPIETPPGRHRLSLEARVGSGDWVSFLKTPIWACYRT